MNCKIFRLQLDNNAWEDGGPSMAPEMQTHLELCAACRAHFQIHRRLLHALENDPAPALPANFTDKILGRLEPMPARPRAQIYLNWKRVATYAGYAFALILAVWVVYKNVDLNEAAQLLNSPFVRQIQQGLAAVGAMEMVQSLRDLLVAIFSFIPTTNNLIEKTFGTEILPKAFNLIMILTMTYFVAKASVLIEGWWRRHGS